MTVPEIAEATGLASHIVMWNIMTMRRYGEVSETGRKGAYFLYATSESE
jgi:hypothetical protein